MTPSDLTWLDAGEVEEAIDHGLSLGGWRSFKAGYRERLESIAAAEEQAAVLDDEWEWFTEVPA